MRGTSKMRCGWAMAVILSPLAMCMPSIADEDAPEVPMQTKLETKLLDVSDLVGAAVANDPDVAVGDAEAIESVSDVITSTVAVDSWDINGGMGSLRPSPAGNQLIIKQLPETIAATEKLLNDLRRPLHTTVAIDEAACRRPEDAGRGYASSVE